MIKRILPPYLTYAESFDDANDESLFPEEAKVVEHAVEKRRREFTTGRICARRALRQLGRPAVPLLPGAHGEPRWPAGIVGSITHCSGYRGAVVGEASQATSIGIDAEPNEPLPGTLLATISHAEERSDVDLLTRRYSGVCWDRLLFSAKEAVYKSWFTLTGAWLDFDATLVRLHPREWTGTFVANLLVPGPEVAGEKIDTFSGRWLLSRDVLLTAIVVR
ncbi:4'-phosphopantetheinyl transferase family protein [Phytohabitans sp. LJ34]|uniref:4'-phosphopantetheinyl transferase family protein n=1 Tax=Phytohabitans sp. LJ34 TaxID=3452217 RepID=UPI003F8C17E3